MTTAANRLQPANVPDLRDHIEQQLRDAILDGTFLPGERLVESAIAEQLQVSRAPLREVLVALEREGPIANISRHGFFVIDFDDKDIEEIYSLRSLLEVGAAYRAVHHLSETNYAIMQAIVNELDKLAHGQGDRSALVKLDLTFHESICRAANHGRLYTAWNSIRLQTQLLIGVTSKTHYQHPDEPGQHYQVILDALKAKDMRVIEAFITEHMLDAQARAGQALRAVRASHGTRPH